MSDNFPAEIRTEDVRLLQRRVVRLQGLLRIYRLSLAASLFVLVVLLGLLFFAKAPSMGRAIIIDGKTIAMVRNEKAAAAVRERLLQPAGGAAGGATFREKWEDATHPADGERVLTVNEAVRALKGKVTVLKEAFAIEESGNQLVVVPSREMAQTVLDRLKARYAAPTDAVVRMTKLTPAPMIRPCTELPARIISDEAEAVTRLGRARSVQSYRVKGGDYPERIAEKHDMSLDEFWRLNPDLRGVTLHAGQAVQVLGRQGGLTVITIKETHSSLEMPAPVRRQTSVTLAKGQKKVVEPGRPGRKRVRWEVTMHNEREVSRRALSEEILVEPEPQLVIIGAK